MTSSLIMLLSALCADTAAAQPVPAVAAAPNPYWLDPTRICGPLCLSFLDRHFQGGRPYAEVAALSPPGPEGTNLAQLQAAAVKLGYHTHAFQAPLGRLTRLRRPALVRYVWADEQSSAERGQINDHFVVLLAWDGETERFQVYDPPKSLSWVPYYEVARHYAGLGLVVSNEPLPPLADLLEPAPRWPLAAAAGAWALFVGGLLLWRRCGSSLRRPNAAPSAEPSSTAAGFLIVACAGLATACAEQPAQRAATDTEFDAGDVQAGTVLKHVFRIKNPSDQPLRFERITSTCGCQTNLLGEFPRQVAPGEHAEAEVEFGTAALDGPIERKFVVVTDSALAEHKALPFVLRANVIRPVKLVPEELDFGELLPGQSAERTLLVKLNERPLAEGFRGVSVEGQHLEARVLERAADTLKIAVRMTAPQTAGSFGGRVWLEFADAAQASVSVPSRAQVQGALRTTPARLLVEPKRSVGQEQRLRIEALAGEAFRILGVDCPPGVEAEADATSETAAARQFLVFRAASAADIPTGATIRIRTDHVQQPELLVAVQVVRQGGSADKR